ncbi:signal recognition particle 9 kDa protein isoform X1 [Xenopus laevis]|uniref:Signal recognition particle 9 kDa protein isoform X1 n=1 Tax=Xenopus laevis TaxID=8355 RepID=A0A8J1KS66_XENLA|nr:signal recognition particle 9 kDa protein isoform X1 [Xenopus laevis]
MPYYRTWEEFTRAAEKLYQADPMKVRVVLKYRHCYGNLCIKVTDDVVVSKTPVLYVQDQGDSALHLEIPLYDEVGSYWGPTDICQVRIASQC